MYFENYGVISQYLISELSRPIIFGYIGTIPHTVFVWERGKVCVVALALLGGATLSLPKISPTFGSVDVFGFLSTFPTMGKDIVSLFPPMGEDFMAFLRPPELP